MCSSMWEMPVTFGHSFAAPTLNATAQNATGASCRSTTSHFMPFLRSNVPDLLFEGLRRDLRLRENEQRERREDDREEKRSPLCLCAYRLLPDDSWT